MENSKQHICKFCGKEFSTSQKLGGHVSRCRNNPKYLETTEKIVNKRTLSVNTYLTNCVICGNNFVVTCNENIWKLGKYKQTCSKKCAHKLTVLNTNKKVKNVKISNSLTGRRILNKKFYGICSYCGKEFEYNRLSNGRLSRKRYCCHEHMLLGRHKKLSDACKRNNFGGLNPETTHKHYKRGRYKGIWFDSSWELAFLYYYIDNNIEIQRNSAKLKYLFKEKEYNFYPDFIINNEFYEVKGFWTDRNIAKKEQYPNIHWITRNEIKFYLDYVESKVGNDWINILSNNADVA